MTVRGPEGGLLRIVHGDRQLAPLPQGGYRPVRLAHVNLNSIDSTRRQRSTRKRWASA